MSIISVDGRLFLSTHSKTIYLDNVRTRLKLSDLVSSTIYQRHGDNALQFLETRLIEALVAIQEVLNADLIINNWNEGGKYNQRGYRSEETNVGAKNSQHRFGAAADFHVEGVDSYIVQRILLDNQEKLIRAGLTRMEINTTGWTHIDVRHSDKSELVTFSPTKKNGDEAVTGDYDDITFAAIGIIIIIITILKLI